MGEREKDAQLGLSSSPGSWALVYIMPHLVYIFTQATPHTLLPLHQHVAFPSERVKLNGVNYAGVEHLKAR